MPVRLERAERIEQVYTLEHTILARWTRGDPGTWSTRTIELGQLPDGRFYVRMSGTGQDYAFPDYAHADRAVGELMAVPPARASDGDWYEIPATFNARGKPVDPGWRLVAGRWTRA